MARYPTITDLLAQQDDAHAGDVSRVRWYYQVGVLAWSTFTRWIVTAEAAGILVRREHRRGVLMREGWITLEGRWVDVRRYLRLWQMLSEETDHA